MLDPILTRLIDQTRDQVQPVDKAQVHDQVNAYLHARGQRLAQDLDLGHVQDQDLVQLGRLDAIAQHPDLDPNLAIAKEWMRNTQRLPHTNWHDWKERHRGHRHTANETCSLPGPGPAPEPTKVESPTNRTIRNERA